MKRYVPQWGQRVETEKDKKQNGHRNVEK